MVSQGIENHIETTHCVLQCPHLPPPLSTVSLSSLPNRTGLFPVLLTQSATFHLQALALAVPSAWQAVPTPDCSSAQTVPSERGLPGHPTLRRPLMSAPLPWSLQSDYCMRASLQSLLCVSLFACLRAVPPARISATESRSWSGVSTTAAPTPGTTPSTQVCSVHTC